MTEISRTHRLYEQLRSRVAADRAGTGVPPHSSASPSSPSGATGRPTPLTMVRRLRESGVTDDRALIGRLIEGLLLEEFGEATQGANFQFVLGQVVQTLEQNEEAWALCRACVAEATE